MTPETLPAQDLLARARSGDTAARGKLQRQAMAGLAPWLDIVAERLSKHVVALSAASGEVPASPGALKTIALVSIDDAISAWDGTGSWIAFAVMHAVTAMWQRVVVAFEARTRNVAPEAIDAIELTAEARVILETRIPDVAAAICTCVPLCWLMRENPMGWEAFVVPLAEDHFRVIAGKLPGVIVDWNLTDEEKAGISRIAKHGATQSSGAVNKHLMKDLEQIALLHVARALASSYRPDGHPRIHFVLKVAKNAVLDVLLSYDAALLALRVKIVIEDYRLRTGKEPEIEHIVKELDPKWARGERSRPKYLPSLIRNVIAMLPLGPTPHEAGPANLAVRERIEDLALRAGLNEMERAVLELRLDDISHRDIAMKLGISERISIALQHRAMRRMAAVARGITDTDCKIMELKICEEKTFSEIAHALGIPDDRVSLLWHLAVEQLHANPLLHAWVAKKDWPLLSAALTGYSHAEIVRDSGVPCHELPDLLRRAVAKLRRVNLSKRRS